MQAYKIKNANGKVATLGFSNNVDKDITVDIHQLDNASFTVATIYDFTTENISDGSSCIVKDLDRGGLFVYDSSKVADNNDGTNFNGWIRQYSGAVNVKWFGAKGDGVTDDTSAFQKALDIAGLYKLRVDIPGTSNKYLIAGTLLIGSSTTISTSSSGSGTNDTNNTHIVFTGTDALFALKDGEADSSFTRGVELINIGAELLQDGATMLRLRRIRDFKLDGLSARLTNNNQTCIHLMGERDGGTYLGVFDGLISRCSSTASSTSLTGIVHYKLSGTTDDGQANANTFINCRAAGAGVGVSITSCYSNAFYNIDFEALTEDCIFLDGDATYNTFTDAYFGDMQAGWPGKLFHCNVSNVKYNQLVRYKAGTPANRADHILFDTNYAVSINGDKFVANPSQSVLASYINGELVPRMQVSSENLSFYDNGGLLRKYVGSDIDIVYDYGDVKTFTPDYLLGKHAYMNILTSGGVAIPLAINIGEGQRMSIEVENSSGASINLTWNVGYKNNAGLPASIADGQIICASFVKRSTYMVCIGIYQA